MKRIFSILTAVSLCLSLLVLPGTGAEVMSDWAADEVEQAKAADILPTDMGEDLTAPITRLGFCRLMKESLQKLGKYEINAVESPFDDTDDPDIALLYSVGIVKGTAETTFSPELTITREEAATFLCRTAKYVGISIPELMDDYPYVDVDEISSWALDPVREMFAAQIMLGVGDLRFDPAGTYTKEQSIAAALRLFKAAGGEEMTLDSFSAGLMANIDKTANYCVSPLSIKTALAMAANGANGDTKAQILSAAGISDLDSFNKTAADIISRYKDGETITLNIADSLWLNTDNSAGMKLSSVYTALIEKFFNGGASDVTNSNAVKKINDWVAEKTNKKIDSIIDSPDFAAALVNAVYFKGAWEKDFDERATHKAVFTDINGKKSKLDFMEQTSRFKVYDDGATKIIELPYSCTYEKDAESWDYGTESGKNVSMFIILGECDVEALPSADKFESKNVNLLLPKFRVESSLTLNDILQALGMTDAFDSEKADFRPMFIAADGSSDDNMFISQILHKTYIDVDEEGTEAAAVTAIIMETTSIMPEKPYEFHADKPFTYVIRENVSGEILFAGEYMFAE